MQYIFGKRVGMSYARVLTGKIETRFTNHSGIAAILHVNTFVLCPSLAHPGNFPSCHTAAALPYHFQFTWQIWRWAFADDGDEACQLRLAFLPAIRLVAFGSASVVSVFSLFLISSPLYSFFVLLNFKCIGSPNDGHAPPIPIPIRIQIPIDTPTIGVVLLLVAILATCI